MGDSKRPITDMAAVQSGDTAALVTAVAACAARWFSMADSHIAFPLHASHIAREEGAAKAGLLAEAISRGTSVRMTDVLVRGVQPNTKPR